MNPAGSAPPWMPDWSRLMTQAPRYPLPGRDGVVTFVADTHLGDARAPAAAFLRLLNELVQRDDTRLLVLMGDLFKAWLALPKYWDVQVRAVMQALAGLRATGMPVWLVVGNRDYLLPADGPAALRAGLPFDQVIHEAAVLEWAGRRYGLTHGDLANRQDTQYLKWRRLSRGPLVTGLFHALPGPLARALARKLEASLASTNQAIKIHYPAEELDAFTRTVTPGMDAVFLGHFHQHRLLQPPGAPAPLHILPDWFSTRQVARLSADGGLIWQRMGADAD